MNPSSFSIGHIPCLLWGAPSERAFLFVHGKSGRKEEGADFARLACPLGWQVLSADLPEHGERRGEPNGFNPWTATEELKTVMAWARARWPQIALRANSIGAWFSLLAFADDPPERALMVSPILDMARLIGDMMGWAGVSEERLEREQEIPTSFGETLSWRYRRYALEHPIRKWTCPTDILYAGRDNLTSRETVDAFVRRFGCRLSVMEEGEHWFHTPEQLDVLNNWIRACL